MASDLDEPESMSMLQDRSYILVLARRLRPCRSARLVLGIYLVFILIATFGAIGHAQDRTKDRDPLAAGPVSGSLGVPLLFETNVGQANRQVTHVLRAQSFAAAFRAQGFDLAAFRPGPHRGGNASTALVGNLVGLTFLDARQARVVPEHRSMAVLNMIRGSDPRRWHQNVPAYHLLRYEGLYDGIDMLLRGDRGGLEFAFDIRPGARPETIRIRVDGADRLSLSRTGSLLIRTSGGTIELTPPEAVQIRAGQLEILPSAFVLAGTSELGFSVEGRDPTARVIIDPMVTFSAYFGGDGADGMASYSYSRVGPMRPTPELKISPDGTDFAISGTTSSFDFPQAGDYGQVAGGRMAFAARFQMEFGRPRLIYATIVGGSGGNYATSVAPLPRTAFQQGGPLSRSAGLYLSGWTDSPDFPTSGGVMQETRDIGGGFLVELGPRGQFVRGTLIGHGPDAYPNAIALDLAGPVREHALIVGGAIGFSSGIDETVVAPGSTAGTSPSGGGLDGFVARVALSLRGYRYFTYLGGSGVDVIQDVDVLGSNVYVAGTTTSFDLGTGDYHRFIKQPSHSGIGAGASAEACPVPPGLSSAPSLLHTQFPGPVSCFDGFIARLSPAGVPVFVTYDGTGQGNFLHGIAVDRREGFAGFVAATGSIVQVNQNSSISLHRTTNAGGPFGPTGIFGTAPNQLGESIALDSAGRAHIVGTVNDGGLATGANSWPPSAGGLPDIFYLQVEEGSTAPSFFTYLGGSRLDAGFGIDVVGTPYDSLCAYVLGETSSTDVETTGLSDLSDPSPWSPRLHGASDLLITRLCEWRDFRVELAKAFQPQAISESQATTVRLTVTNLSSSSVQVTVFDDLPVGLVYTGGANGCTLVSSTSVVCRLTIDADTESSVSLPVAHESDQCLPRYSNTARLYPGFHDTEPATMVSVHASANLAVDCIVPCEEDGFGNCYCGSGLDHQCDEGTSCRFGTADAGPDGVLTQTVGICMAEEPRDCRVRYAWVGGTETVTIPSAESMMINQEDMRYVKNLEGSPVVHVVLAGTSNPSVGLFAGERDPPAFLGDYWPSWLTGDLPTLLILECRTQG